MKLEIDPQQRARGARLALIAGVGNVALGLLIPVATFVAYHAVTTAGLAICALAYLALMITSHWTRVRHAAEFAVLFDAVITDLRVRLFDRVRQAELRAVERLDGVERVIRDVEWLADLPIKLLDTIRRGLSIGSSSLYMLVLSGYGFLVWGAAVALAGRLLPAALRETERAQGEFADAADEIDAHLGRAIAGFAQLRVDATARAGLAADLRTASARWGRARVRVDDAANTLGIHTQGLVLAAMGVILFRFRDSIDPATRGALISIMFSLSLGLLFLLRELLALERVGATWRRVGGLIEQLPPTPVDRRPPAAWDPIRMRDVRFARGDRFALHIADFTLRRGELVFVVGPNGSGKTTLFRLLTGLYPPDSGRVTLAGAPADPARLRPLFAAVFADHPIFDRLFGVPVDPERLEALLERFGLSDHVELIDGRFVGLGLSSGQRMRLALVVALLEDRPILVLDEWAAHQDPETRRWFYTCLLPELRAEGRTIIAISHDDRYFDVADRVVHLAVHTAAERRFAQLAGSAADPEAGGA